MKLLLPLALLLFYLPNSFAQYECGTSRQSQQSGLERLAQNRLLASEQVNFRSIEYVPIKFHLVAEDDGSARVNESEVIDLLCIINADFASSDLQFYLDLPFNYIDNESLYEDAMSTEAMAFMQEHKADSTINVFITGYFLQSTATGFYQGPAGQNDYIVLLKTAIHNATASHELGHFFSLAHPFYGWEASTTLSCDSFVAPEFLGGIPVEKMDMSNCMIAGDQICDTPPDYGMFLTPCQVACEEYSGLTYDPCGVLIDPMESNIMSHYSSCDDYVFTPDQIGAIQMDYNSPEREYIQHNYEPNLVPVLEPAQLFGPIDGEVTDTYDEIEFEWEAVDGADYYFLEIDFFPNFSGIPYRIIASSNSIIVENDFDPDKTYYWRVRGFNDFSNCGAPYSETGVFKSGLVSDVIEIENQNKIDVFPNPLMGSELVLEISSGANIEGLVSVYKMDGSVVKQIELGNTLVGANRFLLSDLDLSTGIYFIECKIDGMYNYKKLIVQR